MPYFLLLSSSYSSNLFLPKFPPSSPSVRRGRRTHEISTQRTESRHLFQHSCHTAAISCSSSSPMSPVEQKEEEIPLQHQVPEYSHSSERVLANYTTLTGPSWTVSPFFFSTLRGVTLASLASDRRDASVTHHGISWSLILPLLLFLGVGFSNGIMEIPPLFIDCFIPCISFGISSPSSNSALICNLSSVNTSEDVELLHDEHIIEHMLCSDEEVALLLNKLTRATFRPSCHCLCGMYNEVNAYCRTKRHRWRAALVHNYFNTPWAVLSVVAAVILLALTLFQTFFSVYTYLRPHT